MLKHIIAFLLSIAFCIPVNAQDNLRPIDTATHSSSHLRISLLTCGPGQDIWETFGHSCIRITDSTKTGRERDVVYNYGFLESSEDNTVMHQFLTNRIQTNLETITMAEFVFQYTDEKRSVTEQIFLLDDKQKQQIFAYLKKNILPANKYYAYSTVYDNCATRILAIFEQLYGNRFVPGQVIPKDLRLTFRDLMHRSGPGEIQHKYWFALVTNIMFGCKSDRIASNTEAMYLSDYLSDGLGSATLDGKKLCADKTTMFEEGISWPETPDEPFIIFIIIAAITISGLVVKRLHSIGNVMTVLVLSGTGIIGCYLVYFWAIDAEPGWKDNFNILWALPTNLIILFYGPKVRAKYAIAAISLLILSVLLDILKVQMMPLFEIGPLLLALIFVYGVMYKKNTVKINT